jgi:hypothetical protein
MTKSLNHVYSQPFKTPATLADTDELETDFKELRKWLEKSTRRLNNIASGDTAKGPKINFQTMANLHLSLVCS